VATDRARPGGGVARPRLFGQTARMPQTAFDDSTVRAAMRAYLEAADALDASAELGGEPRDLLDVAERKTVAGMQLRKTLERQGWTAPVRAAAPAHEQV
jgi:hypothetical protein